MNVEKDLHKIFKDPINNDIAPGNMSDAIWTNIKNKEKKASRLKTFSYFVLGVFSVFGSFISIESLINQFSRLGFSEYFSLILSDTKFLALYWREYLLTLLESIPFVSLAVSLLLISIFFISLERITFQIRSKLLTA